MNIIQGFNIAWPSFGAGLVTYPVAKYILTRWGGASWEDFKKLAYKVWDKVKSLKFW